MIIKRFHQKEYKTLSKFIHQYYRKNHILSKSKKLFDQMFYDNHLKKYNFLIAKEKNSILATKGILPLQMFDRKLKFETFMTMWCSTRPTAGIRIFEKLLDKKFNFICGIGSSPESVTYQKYKKFKIGKLNHFYLLSKKIKSFKIARVNKNYKNIRGKYYGENYIKLTPNLLKNEKLDSLFKYQIPKKSSNYLINKYLKSKYYKYYAYGSIKKDKIINIVILRNCYYQNRTAIRIIDYIGSDKNFKFLDRLFLFLFEKNNVEYVDFYSFGIPDREILNCGFQIKKIKDENIIPNHFEPFEKKNKTIIFGYLKRNISKKKIRLFKGDSDMDRPNVLLSNF